ncbi:MAG: anaerobic ribonucleoside-triphosphate reductase activating protein [Parcubacteria group bacterium]
MLIGGLQKTTLIDYPDKIAATIFTIGCNFRCSFCHNPEIVKGISRVIPQADVFDFLKKRKKLLDGVCISGGEPTAQSDLIPFVKKIKRLGYLVKLDTNGAKPRLIEQLIKDRLIDYVAMDVKAPWKKYETIVSRACDIAQIKKSVDLLKQGLIDYEFRSTVLPLLHSREDILEMARQIEGADKYFIQQFKPAKKMMSDEFKTAKTYTKKELNDIIQEVRGLFEICRVR